MRLEPKPNGKYQALSDEDYADVMKEFTKRRNSQNVAIKRRNPSQEWKSQTKR